MIRILVGILALTISVRNSSAQSLMMKSNLLYAGATLTPNLGAEIRLGDGSTLDIKSAYNPWNKKVKTSDHKKFVHWMTQAELRYWPCRSFAGHFLGIHLIASQYDINQMNIDFIMGHDSEKYRFRGYGFGAGISYGYQWLLGKNWSIEANVGIGSALLNLNRYEYDQYGDSEYPERKTYWGPTRFGINLMYFIK